MFKMQSKGWLAGAPAALLLFAGAAFAQTPDAGTVVAQAATDPALNTTGSLTEPQPGEQSIQMSLAEPERDVMTREAMAKLDAEIGSLTFKDTDLADVIRFIGRKLDLNFIFDSDVVKGNITLTFRNVRVRDALDSILTAQKLALVPDKSGIFRIVPANRVGVAEVETRTEVITLNWVSAADVATTMRPFLSEHGKMEINEESNVVIITDVPPNLENIKSLIGRVDMADRQVSLQARLVDVNIGALRNLTTDISVSRPQKAGTQAPGMASIDVLGVANLFNEGFSNIDGVGSFALGHNVGILGSTYNIQAAFTFLENRSVVEILANPSVTTLNNVPAKIEIIEKIPYVSAQEASQGVTTQKIEFADSGVRIEVKPIITPNGFVRMEIALSQMIFRKRVGSEALAPPQIDQRNASTNVIVETGNTVVLGGLNQIRKLETIDGVPYLHRIPLFGWLFKDKNYDQARTELVLMMTPTVIEKTRKLSDREQYWHDKIEHEWGIPDYFMDDVEGADQKRMPEPAWGKAQ